ncbi:MAG: class I SAM-dependent methyltransferase [Candidatus Symbiothrix sp.]|jgi:2-polyprenyl-3-methyl-5-hydroxy-6-metoxy-1,4-benzoquinol methylase|nr:class I SAM-dependent methyltransferase [Candidatus Symbiothrix sp.]
MPQFIYNTCPICGSKSFSVIGTCSLGIVNIEKPDKVQAVKCKKCKLIFANPLPVWNKNDFSALYGQSYFPAMPTSNIREYLTPERRYKKIEKYIQTKNQNVLEFGAGIHALMAKYLYQEQHWNIAIQEPSQEFVAVLKKDFPQANVTGAEFLDMDTNKKYSLIYADSVLEHVSNPIDYIQKCADMLEAGGVLYFISPNEYSFRNWLSTLVKKMKGKPGNYLSPFTVPYHLIGFSKKSLKIISEKTGLKLVKRIKKHDYESARFIERNEGLLKYPVAWILLLADLLGWGTNQEIILRKDK